MKLSDDRRSALYAAISEPIISARIANQKAGRERKPITANDVDLALYRLEQEVWSRVKAALNIED